MVGDNGIPAGNLTESYGRRTESGRVWICFIRFTLSLNLYAIHCTFLDTIYIQSLTKHHTHNILLELERPRCFTVSKCTLRKKSSILSAGKKPSLTLCDSLVASLQQSDMSGGVISQHGWEVINHPGPQWNPTAPRVEFFHDDLTTYRVARTIHGHRETDVLQDAFLKPSQLGYVVSKISIYYVRCKCTYT